MALSKFDIAEWTTLILGAVVTAIIYRKSQEKTVIQNGKLFKSQFLRRESLVLDAIVSIKYRYYAEDGFVAVWEFVDNHDNKLIVESTANGLQKVFEELQHLLPGFSLADFEQQINHAKREDCISIWTHP